MTHLKNFFVIAFNFLFPAHTIDARSNALIKLTAIVDQISGKLNGTVFARNKGGAYIRSKSNPTNPQTTSQMAQRATFGGISQLWRGLTESQRSNWDATATDYPYQNSLGDTKTLSGFGLHQQLNRNLALIGKPLISAPLAPATVVSPAGYNVEDNTPTKLDFSIFYNSTPTSDDRVLVYATDGISPGVSNFKNKLRLIGDYLASDFTGLGGGSVFTQYQLKFDAPIVGAKIGFKVVCINGNTGQASAPLFFSGITIAD